MKIGRAVKTLLVEPLRDPVPAGPDEQQPQTPAVERPPAPPERTAPA